ncbi:hypothetical protein [Vibrio bivalvicida]|uniref:DUF3108 domain-containing protein n=1 Tax=Vibrio bivalvicida TaxID=1276888 RepID=A0ABV4MIJ5_9VIBR
MKASYLLVFIYVGITSSSFANTKEFNGFISGYKEYTIISPIDGFVNFSSIGRHINKGSLVFEINSYILRAKTAELYKDYLESKYILREFRMHNTVDKLGRVNQSSKYFSFATGSEKEKLLEDYKSLSYKMYEDYILPENQQVSTSCNAVIKDRLALEGAFVEKGTPVAVLICLDQFEFVTTIPKHQLTMFMDTYSTTSTTNRMIKANVILRDVTLPTDIEDFVIEKANSNYKVRFKLRAKSDFASVNRLKVMSMSNEQVLFEPTGTSFGN